MRFFFLFFLCCTSVFCNEYQAKKFQKIVAFYKDEQFDLAQKNIELYLKEIPSSPYHKALQQMLVYFYIKKNESKKAIGLLESISSLEENPLLYLQYLDLLCQMKSFEKLLFALEKVEALSQFQTKKSDLDFYKALAFYDLAQNSSEETKRDFYLKIKKLIKHPIKKAFQAASNRMLFEIEAFFENHSSAMHLAKKIAQSDAKFLFYEAYHCLQIEPKKAIEQFIQLIKAKHAMSNHAAYLVAKKLSDDKNFEQICSLSELLQPFFSNPAIEIMVCKALIMVGKLEEAKSQLVKMLSKKIDGKSKQFASIQLLKVCFDLEDVSTFETTLRNYATDFKDDSNLLLFEYHLAVLFKNAGLSQKAIAQFKKLEKQQFDQSQNVLTHLIELHFKLEQFDEAYLFSKKLTNICFENQAISFFLYSLCNLSDSTLALFELISLQLKLQSDHLYQPQVHLMIAQKAVALQKQTLAHTHLKQLLQIGNNKQIAQAHFLLGLISTNPITATHHLEIALKMKVEAKDQKAIWTRLFNLYNHLATNKQVLPKGHPCFEQTAKDRATHYLYLAFCENPSAMDIDHVLYLIDTKFEELIKLSSDDKAKRTIHSSEPLLHLIQLFDEVQAASLSKEVQMLIEKKKGITLGLKGWHQEKIEILSRLIGQANPLELGELYYEIAVSYEHLRLFGKAKKAFFEGKKQKGYHADQCLLRYVQMHKDKKEMLSEHLNALKEIVLNKSIEHEPLFLIAALEYIDLSMMNSDQLERELFLMERFIDDFSNTDDPFAANYHKKRTSLEEKNRIWQRFITYGNYRVQYLKAKINGKPKNFEKTIAELEKNKHTFSEGGDYLRRKIDLLILQMNRL